MPLLLILTLACSFNVGVALFDPEAKLVRARDKVTASDIYDEVRGSNACMYVRMCMCVCVCGQITKNSFGSVEVCLKTTRSVEECFNTCRPHFEQHRLVASLYKPCD